MHAGNATQGPSGRREGAVAPPPSPPPLAPPTALPRCHAHERMLQGRAARQTQQQTAAAKPAVAVSGWWVTLHASQPQSTSGQLGYLC